MKVGEEMANTTNAQRIFDLAMGLMDEVDSSTGATDTDDTAEYKIRSLFILNTLRGELYPYSDTYKRSTESGKRPIVTVIEDFETVIDLDDYICQTVMPYGLAAHLLLNEDPANANFFMQRYEELKRNLSIGMEAGSEDIVDVYSGGYYDEDGVWHSRRDPIGFSAGGRWI